MLRKSLCIFGIFIILVADVFAQKVETLVQGPSTFNDGLAVDSSGNIYASRYYSSTVTKITPDGNTEIFANGFADPNGLAVGPDGNLYVANASGGRIDMVTPGGEVSTVLSGLTNPTGVTFDSNGRMIIAHYQISRLSVYESGSEVQTFMTGNGLNGPVGVVFDNNDNLYIGNFNNGKILKRTPDGTVTEIGDIPGWLGFITYTNGFIYATAFERNRIYKISADGSGQEIFAGTGSAGNKDGDLLEATFNGPNGISSSATGDTLYISDFGSRSLRMITGINPKASLATVDSINFGEADINTSVKKSFTIINEGNADLEISEITVNDSAFVLSQTSAILQPGEQLEIDVTFTPLEEAAFTASIMISSNVGEREIVLSGIGKSVVRINDEELAPDTYLLLQNYPNPFNPETTITFQIPEASYVSLSVYNSLGQEVRNLVSDNLTAGRYDVNFNAEGLTSGLYFCQISTNRFTQSRKMLLVK